MTTNDTPVLDYKETDAEAKRRERRNRKRTSEFWRACRFLYPYRGMVATSIVCALFIGIAFTGGLGSMVPIMQVFLKGDTIASWANRSIAERRLGVTFDQEDQQREMECQIADLAEVAPLGTDLGVGDHHAKPPTA